MKILLVLSTVAVTLLSYFLYKKSKGQKSFLKECLLACISILILSIGLELSLFNCNFYLSKGYKPQNLNNLIEQYKTKDNDYLFWNDESIILPNVNIKVKNIEIKLNDKNSDSVTTKVLFTDEANCHYFSTPQRTIYKEIPKSQYINIHSYGKCENLFLQFNSDEAFTRVESITINTERPFDFSFLRVTLLFLLLAFIYIFKPSSPIYKVNVQENKDFKFNLSVGFILLQCIAIILVGTMNPAFLGIKKTDKGKITTSPLKMENHNQYDELAQAILKGKVYIDNDDIPEEIKLMNNPYDIMERTDVEKATGVKFRWDVAYFNGHYYVYFGIVPLLLMYLPFRAIFNSPFPSAFGVMLFAMLFSIGVYKLLGIIIEKKFKKTSVGQYLFLSILTINCSGVMFLVKRPDFYSVPIITGITFIVWGIYLWLQGINKSKHKKLYYFFGSLCCALAVGCRPQMALLSFIALPIFWNYFIKDKNIIKKDGLLNLITLGIPYIAVAASLMYYNYIRFGSPIEFGSIYNLTTNDVTRRGFDFGRTGLGIFTYLFQPPAFNGTFPFIEKVNISTNYVGKTITENCFGGLFATLPILWFMFALPKVKNNLKEKKLFSGVISLLVIGTAIVIANTQAGGLLQRYFSDFGFIFFFAVAITILALVDLYKSENYVFSLNSLIFASGFLSIIYAILLVFSVSDVTIDIQNPTLFGNILHTVEFWL